MNNELEENILSLPDYALNSEIEDLETRIGTRISIALQYACRSWYNHLGEIRGEVADLIPHIRLFLEEKFLAWLEVLSVLGDAGSASDGLEQVIQWLQEVCFDVSLHCLALTYEESGCKGQPAPGHRPRLFPFRNEVLRTCQYFCDPHLSLCSGVVSFLIHRPKVVLRPVPRQHSVSKSGDWEPGFMGPNHILFW